MFNHRKNDAARLTFDDIFHKRFFNSYIVKESNKYDRKYQNTKLALDALLESERIKEEIFHLRTRFVGILKVKYDTESPRIFEGFF